MTATDIDYSDTVCTLSADEQRVAQMLGDAWNQYLKLPIEHPCERDEFCRAIHVCQSIVLARPAVRGLASKGQGYQK
ncbi:TPA: hypothetical protein ACTR19_001336 [Yersinia enterocolitica]|uniref:Uncharacterized protein n=2 Tax=Yersinia TaxID=629 RepID=A0AAD2V316_YEREN|nr:MULTISPECIES: hypothetical protein [Yersinia]EKN3563021.1 hypothetical protein [Yersinia enterocolitica]EKN4831618.1 hypothetical protein [Yersinia enterocolitica]EKN6067677.1 hypothetical protein [Yersinia enterocolitica]EKN6097990.1 hypothetical protein [Yersinia enterocolitica]ELI7994043.1 hypothetical protein [Yersinia enterocolitica]